MPAQNPQNYNKGGGGPAAMPQSVNRPLTSTEIARNTAARTYMFRGPKDPKRVAAGQQMWENARSKWYSHGMSRGLSTGRRQGLAAGAGVGAAAAGMVGIAGAGGNKKNSPSRQRPVNNSTTKIKSGQYAGKRVPKGNG
jgi:hypothetical protein